MGTGSHLRMPVHASLARRPYFAMHGPAAVHLTRQIEGRNAAALPLIRQINHLPRPPFDNRAPKVGSPSITP